MDAKHSYIRVLCIFFWGPLSPNNKDMESPFMSLHKRGNLSISFSSLYKSHKGYLIKVVYH